MIGLKKFNYIVWFLKTDLELKQTKQDKKVQKTGHYVNLFLLTNQSPFLCTFVNVLTRPERKAPQCEIFIAVKILK